MGAQHPSSGWNTPARGYTLRTRGSRLPDRLLAYTSGDVEVLEIKTAARPDDLGRRAAALLCRPDAVADGCSGVLRARVAVLTAYLEFDS